MPTLTYDAMMVGDVQVGEPLGMDSIGWPYRVADVLIEHGKTYVELEPWPLLSPAASELERTRYAAAMRYAAFGAGPVRPPCVP